MDSAGKRTIAHNIVVSTINFHEKSMSHTLHQLHKEVFITGVITQSTELIDLIQKYESISGNNQSPQLMCILYNCRIGMFKKIPCTTERTDVHNTIESGIVVIY